MRAIRLEFTSMQDAFKMTKLMSLQNMHARSDLGRWLCVHKTVHFDLPIFPNDVFSQDKHKNKVNNLKIL